MWFTNRCIKTGGEGRANSNTKVGGKADGSDVFSPTSFTAESMLNGATPWATKESKSPCKLMGIRALHSVSESHPKQDLLTLPGWSLNRPFVPHSSQTARGSPAQNRQLCYRGLGSSDTPVLGWIWTPSSLIAHSDHTTYCFQLPPSVRYYCL